MKYIKIFTIVHIVLLTFTLFHCNHLPTDIKSGTESCEFCKMKINDLRFNSQVLTVKGRKYHFDSIECMLSWKSDVPLKKRWVKGYSSKKWIEVENAILFQSKELKSPMGAGLSAYRSKPELDRIKKEYNGNEISLQYAIQYVETEWSHRTIKQ
jgi:copper chaperone NosL